MIKFLPILLALAYGYAAYRFSMMRSKAELDALVEAQPVLVRISAAKRIRDAAERGARTAGEANVSRERLIAAARQFEMQIA